ncbi:MAG: family 16 glycoside hydrolase [Pirellulales bacterium]
MQRRTFLALSLGTLGGLALRLQPGQMAWAAETVPPEELFKISLAQWSLHRTLNDGKLDNLDFPRVAKRDFEIDAVELVDQFFADKVEDAAYLDDLKSRAEGEGVRIGLVMIDTAGSLGAMDVAARSKAIDQHKLWIDAAKRLGCYAVRINARGEQQDLAQRIVDSGRKLADHAAQHEMSVIIENHGGPSSDPDWLVRVMEVADRPNFGTLPDFGNFPDDVDRYDAVEALLPFAKAVSAKAVRFSEVGILDTDYDRMMRHVRDSGYTGDVGIETSPPSQEEEARAIEITRDVLREIRQRQSQVVPILSGDSLDGWTRLHGGQWSFEDGVLVGRNGEDWTTNPEVSGSWLRTDKEYGDFRLELQFAINENGNSGVFFRSAQEKNPAFTGYELQIHDSYGREPTKGGAGSLYDVIAPTENRIRPAGEWNTATIVAKGQHVRVELNGAVTVDTDLTRRERGFIGLQNHDQRSVVKFRNVRVQEL